ncbi:GNAT family N-acetyltransferase [Planococcus sp. N028]|uniref:GNAT family N-acetyltransferase n=1 Tax=Planococcus shixiaomingii TaxID=3058393 RepID=A0ABT8N3F3_9BACL|nr:MULTISPECIES: GNAT family N-acetyltransferase [unclassified Planococcus (in: firmicutes)]MDN7242416.1 GNAT family N-acetyltransferase [Planococcus sp. N028]WKA54657.1 GNAT family N-acetyltransferase [Planococcus sp. N022]
MTKKHTTVMIRPYEEKDFQLINVLNQAEGWNNLVDKQEDTKQAWNNSAIAFVAEANGEIVGCFRGLTDGFITLYVCELLIHKDCRGQGIGRRLLAHAHELYPKTRLELLASSTSHTYYESEGFRPFYGFRKTILE